MLAAMSSCSTQKNTGTSRFWHAFTARYNTYFNGSQAYIEGSLEKERGNKDNFTERLPLYTVGNKSSRELGKSNYETAILKSKKAIQLHSIKKKPEWTKSRRKTEKDIEWLSRKEYNPFLWRAWMLMGRSQFYKGDFDEATATFAYMSRLYKGQPAIYGKARAWLAKCYIENNWLYDAEDVIRNMQRDSIDWRAQKEWDYTLADYYLHTDNLPLAAEYLRKVIKHEMRSKQRAREYFILGQVEAAQGNSKAAYEAFRKVIKQYPPYELEFNARISMTEVMAQGQAKKMIGKLRRMARNDNNKEYLDQVYYAIGNIYLAEKDTASAIAAYEKGNEKATRSGLEKGVLLLHLGDLYWIKEKYGDAKRCYGEAIGLLDKERPDYKELSDRSKVLDELVPFTDAIQLQDSLQELSRMDEKDRNAAIDRVIDALKKKEKEERAKAAEEAVARQQAKNGGQRTTTPRTPTMPSAGSRTTTWYFYNPTAVQQGKQTFQQNWGKRENADDWQRINKTVVGGFGTDSEPEVELTPEQQDSIAAAEALAEKEKEKMDSAVNDPHKREYYLAQIPFTEEQKAASDEIIKDGLLHSAIIFKDKLDNLPLSEKAFRRLMEQYPDFEPKEDVYYHMFLLHSRKGEHDIAQTYVSKLKEEFPESKWTIVLTDPYFADNARFGKHLEDSIYGATYDAFKADRFSEVYGNAEVSEKRFPLGDNRDRFIFIEGMTRLNDGDADACLAAMQKVVQDYPKSSVAEMAGMIINGVQAGRRLHGAKFDLSDVWNRRTVVLTDNDSTDAKALSPERNTNFLFIMAYEPDSLNENQLLFQMARYNFTSFLVRNFDITIEDMQGMHHMTVSGFRNFDEARQYAKLLMQQASIKTTAVKARPIVISEENLALLGSRYSYNDYDTFYVNHFAPLPVSRPEQLYEPVISDNPQRDDEPIRPALPTEEVAPGGAKPEEPSSGPDDGTTLPAEEEITLPAEEEITIPTEEEITLPTENAIAIPTEEIALPAEDTITIPTEEIALPTENTIAIPTEEIALPAEDTITIPTEEIALPAEDTITIPTEEIVLPAEDTEEIIIDDPAVSIEVLEDEYFELDGF